MAQKLDNLQVLHTALAAVTICTFLPVLEAKAVCTALLLLLLSDRLLLLLL